MLPEGCIGLLRLIGLLRQLASHKPMEQAAHSVPDIWYKNLLRVDGLFVLLCITWVCLHMQTAQVPGFWEAKQGTEQAGLEE